MLGAELPLWPGRQRGTSGMAGAEPPLPVPGLSTALAPSAARGGPERYRSPGPHGRSGRRAAGSVPAGSGPGSPPRLKLMPLPVAAPGKAPSGRSEEGGSGFGAAGGWNPCPPPPEPHRCRPRPRTSPLQAGGEAAPLGAGHTAGPPRSCLYASKPGLIFLPPPPQLKCKSVTFDGSLPPPHARCPSRTPARPGLRGRRGRALAGSTESGRKRTFSALLLEYLRSAPRPNEIKKKK